jgi:uncharacterized membrane protein
MVASSLSESERAFAAQTIRRKAVFRTLAIAGVAIGAALALYYGWERARDPSSPLASHLVLVVLILLNARQNLRQHKYAVLLEKLTRS